MESKMTLKTIGSLFVMLLLVQMSTQQFSYSANWGKRKADYSYETECLTALRLKTLVENQIANYYDKSVFVSVFTTLNISYLFMFNSMFFLFF